MEGTGTHVSSKLSHFLPVRCLDQLLSFPELGMLRVYNADKNADLFIWVRI